MGAKWLGRVALVVLLTLAAPAASPLPASAAAGATVSYDGTAITPLPPKLLLDTATGFGAPRAPVGKGKSIVLQVAGRAGVPSAGVGAVVLTVSAVQPTATSAVTVWPDGASRPATPSLQAKASVTTSNSVIVEVGVAGKVRLFNANGSTHIRASVSGWAGEGQGYQPGTNVKILDTRSAVGAPQAKVGAGKTFSLDVAGRGGVPASGAESVVLNVTAFSPTANTAVTVWEAGEDRPSRPSMFAPASTAVATTVVVPLSDGGDVFLHNSSGSTHLVATVSGFIDDVTAFTSLASRPLLDTRTGLGAPKAKVGAGSSVAVQVLGRGGVPASGVAAVVLNVAAVSPSAVTSVKAWRNGTTAPTPPLLYTRANVATSHLIVVRPGDDGKVAIRNASGSAHLVATVSGWTSITGASPTKITLLESTVMAGAGDVTSVTTPAGPTSTIKMASGSDVPAVGGHIVVMPSRAAPYGYLGTVTSVTPTATGTQLSTEAAKLDDVFFDFESSFSGDMPGVDDSADVQVQPLRAPAEGPSRMAASSLSDGALSMTFLKSGDVTCNSGADIDANIALSFQSSAAQWDFDLSEGEVQFLLTTTPVLTSDVAFTDQVSCTVEIDTPIKWPIPGTPLFVDVGGKVTISANTTATSNVVVSAPISLGFQRVGGVSTNLSDASMDGTATFSPSEEMIQVAVTPAVTLGLTLFSVVGAEIAFGMELAATRDEAKFPCVAVTFGPVIEISAKADVWFTEWKLQLATLKGEPVELYSTTVGCPLQDTWVGTIKRESVMGSPWNGLTGSTSTWTATIEVADARGSWRHYEETARPWYVWDLAYDVTYEHHSGTLQQGCFKTWHHEDGSGSWSGGDQSAVFGMPREAGIVWFRDATTGTDGQPIFDGYALELRLPSNGSMTSASGSDGSACEPAIQGDEETGGGDWGVWMSTSELNNCSTDDGGTNHCPGVGDPPAPDGNNTMELVGSSSQYTFGETVTWTWNLQRILPEPPPET